MTFLNDALSTKPLCKSSQENKNRSIGSSSEAWVNWIWQPYLHPCHSCHFIFVMENMGTSGSLFTQHLTC